MDALYHNLTQIDHIVSEQRGCWTLVTKVLCGHQDLLKAIIEMGIRSVGDTRLDNLNAFSSMSNLPERWYLRVPHLSITGDLVRLSEVSLNSEIETIRQIDRDAGAAGKRHGIIVMIELGDLREGVLPGSLIGFYNNIFSLPNIDVLGIGANLGCLSGAVPSIDQIMQLVLYKELLELKFNHKLPIISAGTSVIIPLLQNNRIPNSVNHWRIGESAFLGSDLLNGGTLEGFRDDVFILEAEIAEIKHKSMTPLGEVANVAPFEPVETDDDITPGQRGQRALISVGELDTDVHGLIPLNPDCRIVGASSDISVVHTNTDVDEYSVGDTISFKLSYAALLRLMNGRYIPKIQNYTDAPQLPRKSVQTAPPEVTQLVSRLNHQPTSRM
jgi:predicted amino acid racemase